MPYMPAEIKGGFLICPSCGEEYLHQGRVEVFLRQAEDSPLGIACFVDSLGVTYEATQERNPSRRRDGLRIYFECEFCTGKVFSLTISQVKGRTFVQWNPEEERIRASPGGADGWQMSAVPDVWDNELDAAIRELDDL